MTSTASFKDKFNQAFSIFKWDLKSCAGIMTVYAILASVSTIIIFTLCAIFGSLDEMPEGSFQNAIKVFQYLSTSTVYLLTIIFTIVYTVKVYSYLHNKRKADLYGSLPISRTSLFFSKSASAFLFSVIPSLFFFGTIAIVSVLFGEPLLNDTLSMYTKLIIGTLASISAYGLVSVCCGTTVNSVIMFIATCIAYPISAMFIKGVIGAFFYGSYSGILNGHFIMDALNPLAAYEGINVIYWIIFSVVCIVASAFLVKKRKAERAQSSFAYYLPCHIVKVLIAFIAGMFFGVLFGSLNEASFIFFVFGFIIGSVPAFVISHLIFYKGFSKLLRTSIPLGGLIFVVIATMAFVNYDVINYNYFVPNSDDVKSAGFIEAENTYRKSDTELMLQTFDASGDFESKEDIASIITIHNSFLTDKKITSQTKFQNVWVDILMSNLPSELNPPQYCFAYKMNNGRTVTRIYSESLYSEYQEEINTSLITSITSQKQYVEKYSAICNVDADNVNSLIISKYSASNSIIVDPYDDVKSEVQKAATQKILDAFRKDFASDNDISDITASMNDIYVDYYYDEYLNDKGIDAYKDACPDAVCIIELGAINPIDTKNALYSNLLMGTMYRDSDVTEKLIIPASYTNTIEALKEIGVLDSNNELSDESKYYQDYDY